MNFKNALLGHVAHRIVGELGLEAGDRARTGSRCQARLCEASRLLDDERTLTQRNGAGLASEPAQFDDVLRRR